MEDYRQIIAVNISQLRKGESFVGWLYSIAYSKCTH